ncbi:MAG: heme exporter protein CcmD [Hyphomonadaceae bacterium]
MIEGGWSFVIPAYVITLAMVAGLALNAILRARYWAREAKKLDDKR